MATLALASVFAISSFAWAAEGDGTLDSSADRLAGGTIATAADTSSAATAEKPAAQAYTKAHKKLNVNNSKGWVIANGKYYIASSSDSTRVLAVSKHKAVMKTKSSTDKSQSWKLSFDYDTQCYTITNVKTGKALTATNKAKSGSTVKEAKLVKKSQRITRYATRTVPIPTQRWRLYSSKNGYMLVSAQNAAVALDASGTTPKLVNKKHAKNARFWLVGALGTYAQDGIGSGSYIVGSAVNGKTLSIAKSSVKDKAKAQVGNALTLWGQIFDFKYAGNGYYKIASFNSGKLLTAFGNRVVQRSASSDLASNQLWKLAIVGSDGAVQIVNKKTDKALTYDGNALKMAKQETASEGSAVSAKQKWLVSPTATGLTDTGKRALYRINREGSKTKWCIAVDMGAHEFFLFKKAKASQKGAPWVLDDTCRCTSGAGKCTWAGTTVTRGMTVHHPKINAKWCIYIGYGSWIHSVLYGSDGAEQLGWFISHGCIRIPFANAEHVYKVISSGTKIVRWYK